MNRIKAVNLIDSPQSFREGKTAFKNIADKTHEYRVQFIDDANHRNGIVSPPPPRIPPRPTRKPLSCQAPLAESSDPESENSSAEDSDDGIHKTSSLRPKGELLKPMIVPVAPKRLAARSPSPGPIIRRRKAPVTSHRDPSTLSEEEFSRAPRQRQESKANVITASPKRLARRDPSPPQRELRPRRGSRRP